jgi:hypothetical protein
MKSEVLTVVKMSMLFFWVDLWVDRNVSEKNTSSMEP